MFHSKVKLPEGERFQGQGPQILAMFSMFQPQPSNFKDDFDHPNEQS